MYVKVLLARWVAGCTGGLISTIMSAGGRVEIAMSLMYAIDELYEAGWVGGDVGACERASDGRAYPTVESVQEEFARAYRMQERPEYRRTTEERFGN